MFKVFPQNPNVDMLQEKLGLSHNNAKKADEIIRAYTVGIDYNEGNLTKCIQAIVDEYPNSASVKNDVLSEISNEYLINTDRWIWGENLFGIVAYIYTFLSMITDALTTMKCITTDLIGCLMQLAVTVALVWGGNKMITKNRGDKKYVVWFSLANRFMPSFTMVMYLMYYCMKVVYLQESFLQ